MGYIGKSRSERSQQAMENGLQIYSQLSAWQKRAVDKGAVQACEWHHTGKYYSKTNYYDPEDFEELNAKDFPPIPKRIDSSGTWYVLVSAEWGGSKSHPKIVSTNVKVVDKINKSQQNANKYFFYGGYIEEFGSKTEAELFAKTAKLKETWRR